MLKRNNHKRMTKGDDDTQLLLKESTSAKSGQKTQTTRFPTMISYSRCRITVLYNKNKEIWTAARACTFAHALLAGQQQRVGAFTVRKGDDFSCTQRKLFDMFFTT